MNIIFSRQMKGVLMQKVDENRVSADEDRELRI
jgi:hypothetical protein